jgi:hypothetical protein
MSSQLWSFNYFYYMDKANACIHQAPVRFSPITFTLANELLDSWPVGEDITQELAEVRDHKKMNYPLDTGR